MGHFTRKPGSGLPLLMGFWAALTAGCNGDANNFSPTSGADGSSLPDRVVVDLAGPHEVAADVADGGFDAPGAAEDANMQDLAPDATAIADLAPDLPGVMVTLMVESPVPAAIAVTSQRFAPAVTVTVDSPQSSASDVIVEVTATLTRILTKERIGSAKLSQTRVDPVTGTTKIVYKYGDTPLDLAGQASGDCSLAVVAKTLGGVEAQATVVFRLDAGPVIRIEAPGENKFYRNSVAMDVRIFDATFGPVKDVSMVIGQRPLAFSGPGGLAGDQYTATIDFSSYDPPLEGEQLLTVRAKNQNGTETTGVRKFISDSKGPVITNTSPAVGSLIGKVITISADVADPAGVLESSVIAVIAHGNNKFERRLSPPPPGATTPTYKTLFDTTLLPVNALFPSISFRASDVLGNEFSVGYLVSLDNTPPLADLDPPGDFRSLTKEAVSNNLRCSWPFDPVGPDAVDDGDLTAQLFDIRARIEDQGNAPKSGAVDFTPIAGVDRNRAQLLILDDTSQALVVDTNNDGVCDDVNPLLHPTTTPMSSKDALLIDFFPLQPASSPDTTFEPNAPCATGNSPVIPSPICNTTFNRSKTLWRIDPFFGDTPHSEFMAVFLGYAADRSPAVWTIPPVVLDGLQCAGRQFDAFANNVSDGWACLAVNAADKLGNQQVSKVIRICVDHDGNGAECPHERITRVTGATPMVVTTVLAHGYVSGDQVIISGVQNPATLRGQTRANGRWTINVLDPTNFELVGSSGLPTLGNGTTGYAVKANLLPDCTGTQTSKGPPPVVTSTPCTPWRAFPPGESREL